MEKSIQKLLDKLGKKGFDTEKKVNSIDMQVAYDNGLTDELGGILALQKAIKSHSTYAFLMGGTDAKPEKRRSNAMQMMVEPKEISYRPRHMKTQNTEKVDLKKLRELVDQLPEGTILSVDLEEVSDGQDNG